MECLPASSRAGNMRDRKISASYVDFAYSRGGPVEEPLLASTWVIKWVIIQVDAKSNLLIKLLSKLLSNLMSNFTVTWGVGLAGEKWQTQHRKAGHRVQTTTTR